MGIYDEMEFMLGLKCEELDRVNRLMEIVMEKTEDESQSIVEIVDPSEI